MALTVRQWLVPLVIAAVLVPVFCALGFWQLHRAGEKQALQAEYDRRALQAPIQLGFKERDVEALQFFRVQARGTYDSEYQVLWDNRIHRGAAGYHVITPFHIAGGETRVLVNRGWVPVGASRDQLPEITPPKGPVTITGVAVVPRPGFDLGALDLLKRSGITVWQHLDLARYQKATGWSLQPIILLLDPQSPGGYVREWARLDVGVAVHEGYAFQWFMLAAAVVVTCIVLFVRAKRRASAESRIA